jgi:murein DD-endopeptidase MepM/ murein hydrolase activator NlpD
MRRLFQLFLLVLGLQLPFGQTKTKLYYEVSKTRDTITYFADNPEIFPVSISFSEKPILENMRFERPFQNRYVLNSETVKNKIISFVLINKSKKWGVKLMPSYRTFVGDLTVSAYDKDYVYDLPFKKGQTFELYQGYNGTFSHQNENALDFIMPEGTEILAAREGKVIGMVQHNKSGCATVKCADLGNYIKILHSDGTIADYFHLQHNGAKVKLGQEIQKGELIGLSGNTGWSNGPHLHFVSYLPSDSAGERGRKTIKTLFKTDQMPKGEYLQAKAKYYKNY